MPSPANLLATVLCAATLSAADSRPVNLPFKDLSGKKVKVSDLRGKIVVLNFWATWCGPCRAEMPLLVEASSRYAAQGVTVVAVSLDDRQTRPKIQPFLDEFRIQFPVWIGGSTMDLEELGLGETLPATAFLDRDGRIAFRILGQFTKAELDERLRWLAGERSGGAPDARVQHLSEAR